MKGKWFLHFPGAYQMALYIYSLYYILDYGCDFFVECSRIEAYLPVADLWGRQTPYNMYLDSAPKTSKLHPHTV